MSLDRKRRALIVDDSSLVRQVLTLILERHPCLEVVGTCIDPYDAREKIKALDPDVLTLDVEMPKMDGLTFLGKLMHAHPMPVVMLSSLTDRGTQTALDALAAGAVDVIGKPTADQVAGLEAMGADIAEAVYAASLARVRAATPRPLMTIPTRPSKTMDPRALIAIGASTGGTEALRDIFDQIPPDLPAIAVVQHMLPGFTTAFAERLNRTSPARIKVAEEGEPLSAGCVYLAPSRYHLCVESRAGRLVAKLQKGEPVSRHLPSVNALFHSVAKTCASHALGVILTGMGDDGADGLLAIRKSGAHTLGQDELSSVVYGMPRVAWNRGAVAEQSPLDRIPARIVEWCSGSH